LVAHEVAEYELAAYELAAYELALHWITNKDDPYAYLLQCNVMS